MHGATIKMKGAGCRKACIEWCERQTAELCGNKGQRWGVGNNWWDSREILLKFQGFSDMGLMQQR